jgi:TetR/AcrR family transcriptional repressor of nem operon
MGRCKEFDCDEALDAALRVFWEKGYKTTSIQDLVEATGVNRASLYQTYGSKRELFLKALDRFTAQEHNVEQATRDVEPGLARIRAVLRVTGAQAAADARGCLIVNAVVERGAQDEEMQALGGTARKHLEKFFEAELAEAERRGEIRPDRDRMALARFLTNTLFGLRVTAKTRPSPAVIRGIVDTALHFLCEA